MDGSLSTRGPAATKPLTYTWKQIDGPVTVDFIGGDYFSKDPAFIAPIVETRTTIRFSLVVNDGVGDSSPSTVAVTIVPLNEGIIQGSILIVNSNDDMNDGECNTAHCSLREAITKANAIPDRGTILFDFPGSMSKNLCSILCMVLHHVFNTKKSFNNLNYPIMVEMGA